MREMAGLPWLPASGAPESVVVETKIDDGNGVRNVQNLVRSGRLWWLTDKSVYVYYAPTHYRALSVKGSPDV